MKSQNQPILTVEERGYEHPVDYLWDGGVNFGERVASFAPTDAQVRLCEQYTRTPEELTRLLKAMSEVAIDSALERNRLEMLSLESIGIYPDYSDERFREYLRVSGRPGAMLDQVNWFHDNIQDGHVNEIVRGHMVLVDGNLTLLGDTDADPSKYQYKGISEQVKSPSSELGSVIQFGDWTYTRDIDVAVLEMLRQAEEAGYEVELKKKRIDPRRYKLQHVQSQDGAMGELVSLNRERAFANIARAGVAQHIHIIKRSEALLSVRDFPIIDIQRSVLGAVSLQALQSYAPTVGRVFEAEAVTNGRLRSGLLPVSTTYYIRQPRQ